MIKYDKNEKLKWPVKKWLPEFYLNWKLFIETVQQDARNIFHVADFLFRSDCRLFFLQNLLLVSSFSSFPDKIVC